MNAIQNKLKSKNGASIFMGLMFLLVCVMVGTVVLVAATAAAGKLSEQRKREQAYLNVSSAAQLIKDRICQTKYEHTRVVGSGTGGGTLTASYPSGGEIVLEEELTTLCNILAENAGEASDVRQTKLNEKEAEFVIRFQEDPSASVEELEDVYGSLSMKADGRIFVDLWLGDADEANGNNHMKIEFCPDGPVQKTKVESVGDVSTTTVTTTCSWPEGGCTITRG